MGLLVLVAAPARAQRLPGGITPEHYSLTITPDLRAATFTGKETIDVTLDHATDTITLNSLGLDISDAEVAPRVAASRDAAPHIDAAPVWSQATVAPDGSSQQITLHLAQPLPAGPATLKFAYSGVLTDKLRGFYLSKTKKRSYGVTQFEATDARRAFPSFDEPALKATFDVTLVIADGDNAISNTPVESDTPGPEVGTHTVRFLTTPKMSTYLVAWLVGDWACSAGKAEGVPIRVCATPDKAGLTKFALEGAKWDLKYFDRYFGIKYPMAKLDLVAIPDFEAGAMENFGCLTFRETELLVDEKDGAIAAKKEVATTVAHEISHQWFGDMVTMQWWDNLWLNEGFATWMETKASSRWKPEWKFDQDAAEELDGTMDLDAQPTTRAIRTRAETPAEIDEMFDGIAYGKAGAVIDMVENWVGAEVFRRGVHEYLAAHLYGSATAEDFWDAQTRVSGQPVDKVMRSFVEQPGVPVLTLGEMTASSVGIRQARFLLPGGNATDASSPVKDMQWTVPVCLRAAGAPQCQVVRPDTTSLPLPTSGVEQPLYANAGDKGYFRTVYTRSELAAIAGEMETKLTVPERIGMLSDRWALMRGGLGSVGDYMDLALAVRTDPNSTVIDSALGKVEEIGRKIATEGDRERLDAVVRREFGPMYAALGPDPKHEDWQREDLRNTLYEALGDAGDPAVMTEAHRITAELLSGKRPKELTVADSSVALVARHGDAQMYEKMLAVARDATDPGLKTDALHLLTRFEDPLLVIRTLDYAVGDEVRSQDSWGLIALLLERRATQDIAWQYVEQHWEAVSRKMTVNGGARILESAGAFCSAGKRQEVSEFFTAHPVGSERALKKALESIDGCVRLREAQEPELRQWLDAHAGK